MIRRWWHRKRGHVVRVLSDIYGFNRHLHNYCDCGDEWVSRL